MPKKIDPALRDRAVRLVREHRSEYPSLTAASAAVACQRSASDTSPCADGYYKPILMREPVTG
jgi:hypothetical protein